MSLDSAKKHLKKYNLDDRIILLDESSATVSLAALVLGCSEGEIAKSLAFFAPNPILVITAGDVKIDNAKYRHFFGTKAKMVPHDDVLEVVGHVAGGVCPFGINPGIDVYLDVSLKEYDYVYPACGTCNSAIKLSIKELEKSSCYKEWIDVCKK